MPHINVVLDVEYSKTQNINPPNKFKLKAKVTRNQLIQAHVFVFQKNLDETINFCAIATPIQLSEFPAVQPGKGTSFFLLDTVELEFNHLSELNEVFTGFQKDLNDLVNDYAILLEEDLLVNPTFTITYTGEAS